MTDSWTDSNGDSLPSDWTPGGPLTPAGDWSSSCGCAPSDGPAIADSITIKGSPGAITSVQNGKSLWSLVLNDGTPEADFRIDRFDNAGLLADSPMSIVRATGVVSFNDPVMLAEDPLEDMEAATKRYVDNTGLREAPMDQQTYGRDMGQWVALPTIIPDAPNTTQIFGRFNSTWALVPIQADAPNDGGTYGRSNGAWNAALAITGGTITGNLTVTGIMTVNGPNSMVLNAAGGNQRAILGQTAGLTRWQLQLGDQVAEGLNNAGSNFSLTAYTNLGGFLGTWLSIARADGSTTLNGPVNMNNGAAVNGTLALQGPSSFYLPGGSAGQVLSTNGSAALSWANPGVAEAPNDGQYYARQNHAWAVAPGGMTDAPNDGTAYARKSLGWAHLTHADITDWTATLAPYALTTAVPVASTTPPLPSGVAAVGTSTAYARADHVHPSDAYSHDNRIINGDMRIDQRNAGASGTALGYTIDRWTYSGSQASKITWQRSAVNVSSTLTALGFPCFLTALSSSAYTSLAGDTFVFRQPIEADLISDFAWGTTGAQPVTLSFLAYSNQTGVFSGALNNGVPATRAYPFSYSIPTANLWTRIVITIPGDTTGTWTMGGNATGALLMFDLGNGSNFRALAGAWTVGDIRGANGSVSIVGTNGAYFYLTGVKLEIGSVATPYPRQSLAKSMADCQRYYQPIAVSHRLTMTTVTNAAVGVTWAQMRAAPTAALLLAGTRTNVANIALAPNALGNSGYLNFNCVAAGDTVVVDDRWSLTAEL